MTYTHGVGQEHEGVMSLDYMNTVPYQLDQADALLELVQTYMDQGQTVLAMQLVTQVGNLLDAVEYELDK